MREISCPYYKIYHYLILCKAKGYMVESRWTRCKVPKKMCRNWKIRI